MSTDTPTARTEELPRRLEVDHHDPDKFRVRCPDCGSVDYKSDRPEREERKCSTCGRLKGVTPVSEASATQEAVTDGGTAQVPKDYKPGRTHITECPLCGDGLDGRDLSTHLRSDCEESVEADEPRNPWRDLGDGPSDPTPDRPPSLTPAEIPETCTMPGCHDGAEWALYLPDRDEWARGGVRETLVPAYCEYHQRRATVELGEWRRPGRVTVATDGGMSSEQSEVGGEERLALTDAISAVGLLRQEIPSEEHLTTVNVGYLRSALSIMDELGWENVDISTVPPKTDHADYPMLVVRPVGDPFFGGPNAGIGIAPWNEDGRDRLKGGDDS